MTDARRAGVLVDLDGTLVDTNYLHTLAWARAFRDVGASAPMSVIHHRIGMGSEELVQELLGGPHPEAIDARRRRDRELLHEASVLPGAGEALAAWHRSGLVVVVATSSPREEVDAMLELLDADAAIDAVTTADDVDRSKPHPDVFSAALTAGGIDAGRAVVVGDSVWDVHAADRAGLPALCVETGGTGADELRAVGARGVYPDVGVMRDELSVAAVAALHAPANGAAEHRTGERQAAINRALDPPA
jgi:HAD superfamily hydrolase (TIGR01509 family)